MSGPVIIVDSDAIVAQAFVLDSNHKKALQTEIYLQTVSANLLYPRTTIVEAVTTIQKKFSDVRTAYDTAMYFLNLKDSVVETDSEIYAVALQYFNQKSNKKDTLFDCIVAATAKLYNADAIFSFDSFYKKAGFKLASELK